MKNLIGLFLTISVLSTGIAQEPDAALYKEIVAAQAKTAVQLTAKELKKYEGDFEMDDGFVIRFYVKDGALMSKGDGQQEEPMIPQGDHKFNPESFPATATFVINEEGVFDTLVLTQSGREFIARKKEQ